MVRCTLRPEAAYRFGRADQQHDVLSNLRCPSNVHTVGRRWLIDLVARARGADASLALRCLIVGADPCRARSRNRHHVMILVNRNRKGPDDDSAPGGRALSVGLARAARRGRCPCSASWRRASTTSRFVLGDRAADALLVMTTRSSARRCSCLRAAFTMAGEAAPPRPARDVDPDGTQDRSDRRALPSPARSPPFAPAPA